MEPVKNGSIELVGWVWYTGRDSIGVILCNDTTTNEQKAYIGIASGEDERRDILNIMYWGSKFEVPLAKIIVKARGFLI